MDNPLCWTIFAGMEMDADILIVGGGLNGPALGLALAQGGLRVTVIDARPAPARAEAGFDGRAYALAIASRRLLQGIGVWPQVADKAQPIHQIKASDAVGGMGVTSKALRLLLQSGILGLGAYLVVIGEVSAGVIIAGSIVMSRALAPIETVIQHWRGFVDARQASYRLGNLLKAVPDENQSLTELPPPARSLSVEAISVAPPGQKKSTIENVTFALADRDGDTASRLRHRPEIP